VPLLARSFGGETVIEHYPWMPGVGLDLGLRLDGLGLLFVLMILGIGALVILYARWYFPRTEPLGRFYACLLLFMRSMLGLVLSENLIQLLIFWELTSLASFLLISYWQEREAAHRGGGADGPDRHRDGWPGAARWPPAPGRDCGQL
jgi:multicomponent K+:H+ antiporter subunit A